MMLHKKNTTYHFQKAFRKNFVQYVKDQMI